MKKEKKNDEKWKECEENDDENMVKKKHKGGGKQ